MTKKLSTWMTVLAGSVLGSSLAVAQDVPAPSGNEITYSPYPAKNSPNRVYFGDQHLHTSRSGDAGASGAQVGPEDALCLARGEEI